MLKIVAGEFRSLRLVSPPDDAVSRPYPNRVKESVFNLLREWFEDARVLDLFAGVGTMGLEAVSRGAAAVVMAERDRQLFTLLKKNIERLRCFDRAEAVQTDALGEVILARAPSPVDVVFMDPPYTMMLEPGARARVLAQAGRCRAIMADRGFLVLRGPRGPEAMPLEIRGFDGPEPHCYGKDMWVMLYAAGSAATDEGSPGPDTPAADHS